MNSEGPGEGRDVSGDAVASDTARERCKQEEGILRGLAAPCEKWDRKGGGFRRVEVFWEEAWKGTRMRRTSRL